MCFLGLLQDMQDDSGPCQTPSLRAGERKCPRHLPHRQKYALLHRVTQLVETGQVDTVFQELSTDLDCDFFDSHPELQFELLRYVCLVYLL